MTDIPLGRRLAAALADGGCAAVICNTVGRAQEAYAALNPYFEPDELDLFHARYLFGAASGTGEPAALIDFGKDGAIDQLLKIGRAGRPAPVSQGSRRHPSH
jgi:hypothetical protein